MCPSQFLDRIIFSVADTFIRFQRQSRLVVDCDAAFPIASPVIENCDSFVAEPPVEKHRLRRCFHPLAGKLFSDAKNFLCSRKHSLLFAFCKYVCPPVGRTIKPAAVKTGKAAFHSRRNRYGGKDTDRFSRLILGKECLSQPLRSYKRQRVETGMKCPVIR